MLLTLPALVLVALPRRCVQLSESWLAFVFLAVSLSCAFLFAMAFRRRILLPLTVPDFATVTGLRLTRWNVILALINGSVVGVSVATVGPLVTFGFLILPVLAVAAFAKSLHTHLVWAMVFDVITAIAGFVISYHYDLPLGDSVVALACAGLAIIHTLRAIFWA